MTEAPLVGLVMGSDSDWPVMRLAAQALAEFGIPFEADVVSAHRMPTEMIDYGKQAHERGRRRRPPSGHACISYTASCHRSTSSAG